MIVTISRGNQLGVPAPWRKALRLQPGSKLELTRHGDELRLCPIGSAIEDVFAQADRLQPRHRWRAKEMNEVVERALFGPERVRTRRRAR